MQIEIVLGRNGAYVKQVSADTNARISVMDSIPGCDERVAIITSKEDPAQELSGAQVAAAEPLQRCQPRAAHA